MPAFSSRQRIASDKGRPTMVSKPRHQAGHGHEKSDVEVTVSTHGARRAVPHRRRPPRAEEPSFRRNGISLLRAYFNSWKFPFLGSRPQVEEIQPEVEHSASGNDATNTETENAIGGTILSTALTVEDLRLHLRNDSQDPHPAEISNSGSRPTGAGQTHPDTSHQPSTTSALDRGARSFPLSPLQNGIKRFHSDLFYALPSIAPVPECARQLWEEEVHDRLWQDLGPAMSRIGRLRSSGQLDHNSAAVELLLRMSGRAKKGADSVECSATIWILCGSKPCKQQIEKSVKKLSWLQNTQFGLEIHVGGPRFSAETRKAVVPLDRLPRDHPIDLPNGDKLYLHIESLGNTFSANGKLVCATFVGKAGDIVDQRFSRLGGFILVNKSQKFGVTTAHWLAHRLLSPQQRDTASVVDSDADDVEDGPEEEADCCDSSPSDGTADPAVQLGYRHAGTVNVWEPLESTGMINFLGQGTTTLKSDSEWWRENRTDCYRNADFALLNRIESVLARGNCYQLKEGSPKYLRSVEERSPEGQVHILADEQNPVGGYLLDQGSSIHIGDSSLKTRKIELSHPLASGTSGSWVVRDETLCGMIIAIHEHEPFAHMVEASQLFSDIKKSWAEAGEVGLFPTLPGNDPKIGNQDAGSKDLGPKRVMYRTRYERKDSSVTVMQVPEEVTSTTVGVNLSSSDAKPASSVTGAEKLGDDKPGLRRRFQEWLKRGAASASFGRTMPRPKHSRPAPRKKLPVTTITETDTAV